MCSSKDSISPLDAKAAYGANAPQNNFTQLKYLVYTQWHLQINTLESQELRA